MNTAEKMLADRLEQYNQTVNDVSKFKLSVREFKMFSDLMKEYASQPVATPDNFYCWEESCGEPKCKSVCETCKKAKSVATPEAEYRVKDENNAREQNERMRNWFSEITGLKGDWLLSDQMKAVERMLAAIKKDEPDLVASDKRKEAMLWWNNLSSLEKTRICDTDTELIGRVRRWETLTGREIENIYVASDNNTNQAFLASHSCTSSNSIEQGNEIVDAIMNCQLLEFDPPLSEDEKQKMLNFIIETFLMKPLIWYYYQFKLERGIEVMIKNSGDNDKEFILSFKTLKEWAKHTSMLNKDQNPEVCDATAAKSSAEPLAQPITLPSPAVGGMSIEQVAKFIRLLNSDYKQYANGWVRKYLFRTPVEEDIKTIEQLLTEWLEETASPAVKDDWKERFNRWHSFKFGADGVNPSKSEIINWIESNLKQ